MIMVEFKTLKIGDEFEYFAEDLFPKKRKCIKHTNTTAYEIGALVFSINENTMVYHIKNNINSEEIIEKTNFFTEQMLKAFKHGIEYEYLETDGETLNLDDKNLPFYEWFAKYYNNGIL